MNRFLKIYVFFVLAGLFYPAFAYTIPDSTNVNDITDSIKTDISIADSLKSNKSSRKDSLGHIPLKKHGGIFLIDKEVYRNITKEEIQLLKYDNLNDLLKYKINGMPMEMGEAGRNNSYSVFGSLPRHNGFSFNGRNINAPEYGMLNSSQIQVEFMEQAQILAGSDAVIFGNSNGVLFNIQQPVYNTAIPYTRIWFSQGDFDYIASDGIFSQNFAENWNLTLGYRNMGSDGRFENTWFEAWNLRGILRWNAGEYTNISFTEIFTNHGTGTNGGIDRESTLSIYGIEESLFNELEADVFYNRLNERVFRHDMQFTISSYLSSDSATALSGNIFASTIERNFQIPADLTNGESIKYNRYYYHYYGANGRFEQKLLDYFVFRAGGSFLYGQVPDSYFMNSGAVSSVSAYSHGEIKLPGNINISGGFRFSVVNEEPVLSFGAKLMAKSGDLQFLGDLSRSARQPSISEGLNLNAEIHNIALAELSLTQEVFSIAVNSFARMVDNYITAEVKLDENGLIQKPAFINSNELLIASVGLDFKINLPWLLFSEMKLNGYYSSLNGTKSNIMPDFYGFLKFYKEFRVERSLLQLGIEVTASNTTQGYRYIPINRAFSTDLTNPHYIFNGIDLFAIARLGNAFVKAEFVNSLDYNYYLINLYPMEGRHFRLSLAWSFND